MMRLLLIAVVLLGAGSRTTSAQASRAVGSAPKVRTTMPPAAVQTAFARRFPDAMAVRWEKEGTLYEADFKAKDVKVSAIFTASGEFKEVERTMPLSSLPAPVLTYVHQHYPGKPIQEAARIEDAAGTVTWEAEIGKKDVIFTATGAFLREEVEAGDDKDGDD
jgi:Putative beta-lactamase-inhibitor-like, PepSY-like